MPAHILYNSDYPAAPSSVVNVDDLSALLAALDSEAGNWKSMSLSVKQQTSSYMPDINSIEMADTADLWNTTIPIFHSGPRDAPMFATNLPTKDTYTITELEPEPNDTYKITEPDQTDPYEHAITDSDSSDDDDEDFLPVTLRPSEHPWLRCTFTILPPLPPPGTLWLIHHISSQRTDPLTDTRFYLCIGRELRPLPLHAQDPDRYSKAVYIFPSPVAPEGTEKSRGRELWMRWMPEPWVPRGVVKKWLKWKVDNLEERMMLFQDDLSDDDVEMEEEHERIIEEAKMKAMEEWERDVKDRL